jgi:hypothetical protein
LIDHFGAVTQYVDEDAVLLSANSQHFMFLAMAFSKFLRYMRKKQCALQELWSY